MKPVAIEVFAGGGGTALGLRRAGFDLRIAVDSDPAKASTLHKNHPKTRVLGIRPTCGDVREITADRLRNLAELDHEALDLLVGCPPCQGYSIQGKRNIEDPRNRLYLEFVRLAKDLRPRAIAFENVPGIGALHNGFFLRDLEEQLSGIGYAIAIWHLQASDFGIPQKRERIFVVGILDGSSLDQPKPAGLRTNVWEAISDLPTAPSRGRNKSSKSLPYRRPPSSHYAAALRGRRHFVDSCERTRHNATLVRRLESLKWNEIDEATKHRRLDPKGFAPTLKAGTRSLTSCRPVHPYANRVITVREAARLSSFPDWYKFPVEIAEAWSQIGNAVPPLVAETVFTQLKRSL